MVAQSRQRVQDAPQDAAAWAMLGKVRAFAADRPQFDDITLLVVRYAGE